jgi:nitrate reductase alpha subunit
MGAHGVKYAIEDLMSEVESQQRDRAVERGSYPSLKRAEDAANMILHFAPETNGELAYRAYQFVEKKVGRPLADLAEKSQCARDLSRSSSAAASLVEQPDLVRSHSRRAGVLGVHLQL